VVHVKVEQGNPLDALVPAGRQATNNSSRR
jgi:hypothetical protein